MLAEIAFGYVLGTAIAIAIFTLILAIGVAIFFWRTKKSYQKGYMSALGVAGRDMREYNKMTDLFQQDLFNIKIYGIWGLEDWEPLADIVPKLKREFDRVRRKDPDQWKRLMVMWAPILVSVKKGANDISVSNARKIITELVDAFVQLKMMMGDKIDFKSMLGAPGDEGDGEDVKEPSASD